MQQGVKMGQNVCLAEGVQLGARVTLGNNVTLHPGVVVEDDAVIMDGAVVGRAPRTAGNTNRPLPPPGPTRIGSGSLVGCNAVLYNNITIGKHVLLGDLCSMREGCVVEEKAVIGRGVQVMYDTKVGARTRVIDGAILTGNMTIESDVFIGPGVCSVNDDDVYLKRFGLAAFSTKGPTVRRFALIGTGANLAASVEIGMGAIVAPSAMVTRDVPAWTVVAGVPAKVMREVAPGDRAAIEKHFGISTEKA